MTTDVIYDNLPTDQKEVEDKSIVGTDIRGSELSHYVLSERLMQVEGSTIKTEINEEGYSDTLIYILEGGFRGFHKMSSGELWSEWKDGAEAKWFEMYDDKSLPWATYDEDPTEMEAEAKEAEAHPG
tara:strand:+ start:977 stop:1357 length:381 start_codon:yes stop_codon:yes gene_type:complete